MKSKGAKSVFLDAPDLTGAFLHHNSGMQQQLYVIVPWSLCYPVESVASDPLIFEFSQETLVGECAEGPGKVKYLEIKLFPVIGGTSPSHQRS